MNEEGLRYLYIVHHSEQKRTRKKNREFFNKHYMVATKSLKLTLRFIARMNFR